MSDLSSPLEDPLLTSARREMRITLVLWLLAMAATLGVSLTWGYHRDPKSLTFVLGFPDWVFWGIIVPWAASTVVSMVFSLAFMQDAPLETEAPPEAPR
jgi:hypothetical protein